jgi:formylglycine-generating enzyme required for sulfatase activity
VNGSGSNRCFWGNGGMLLAALVLVCVGCSRTESPTPEPVEEVSRSAAPPLAVAPFDAAAAKGHQSAWSRYLAQPVEVTNSLGMKFTLIPAGEFLMGSPRSEIEGLILGFYSFLKDVLEAEQPQHRVRITKPYYLGMYEVTQAEYERVMGTNPSAFSQSGPNSAWLTGLDTRRFPVEQASWEDAMEFCRELSALSAEQSAGRVYRLPTEAEWEFACRAGTTTPFHFGSQLNGCEANCNGDYPYGTTTKGAYLKRPTTVGSYGPNGFGLYDMHGNVWEWCSDWYDTGYYANSPIDDPTGPASGLNRVIRGGCWCGMAEHCRSARRDGDPPSIRDEILGCRVAFRPVDASGR